MAFWTLRAIDIYNPHTVVIECVPSFLESGAGCITQHALRRMGYVVDSRVFNAADYGALTRRKRAVLVATTFDSVDWPAAHSLPKDAVTQPLSCVLLPPGHSDCEWFTRETESKQWLFDHWAKQTAKGNGLVSGFIRYSDETVPVIKKRYFAGQGDNPVVVHPDDPNQFRWLTVGEVKGIMGLPAWYDLGETKTTAGEILGQGVEVTSFTQIIQSVTRTSNRQLIAA
jgi:site-specific DNA-cytosine methylase